MENILETDRLILREFVIDDAKYIYDLDKDLEVNQYTGDISFTSLEEAKNYLNNYADYQCNGFGRWAVILKDNHEFLGWCGLKRHKEGWVDIAYRFYKINWGKGYATEAAIGCFIYGFKYLNIPEIIGRAHKENHASIRVFEKLGMKYWKADTCNGIPDAVYYKTTKDEFLITFPQFKIASKTD